MRAGRAHLRPQTVEALERKAKYLAGSRLSSNQKRAAEGASRRAKELQTSFERLPKEDYRDARVFNVVRQILGYRKEAYDLQAQAGNTEIAPYELGLAGRCLRAYSEPLVRAGLVNKSFANGQTVGDLLKIALDLHLMAAAKFRSHTDRLDKLAYQLSFAARILALLRTSVKDFRAPWVTRRLIDYRGEAGSIFEACNGTEHDFTEEIYFEYSYLARTFQELTASDPLNYIPLAECAATAASAAQKYGRHMKDEIKAWRTSAEAYQRAAELVGGPKKEFYEREAALMREKESESLARFQQRFG